MEGAAAYSEAITNPDPKEGRASEVANIHNASPKEGRESEAANIAYSIPKEGGESEANIANSIPIHTRMIGTVTQNMRHKYIRSHDLLTHRRCSNISNKRQTKQKR